MFNGQNSVLWNNVRDAFPTEIVQMYQTLRSNGTLSYDNVRTRFENHQKKWSEAIFNEDAWFKYIAPLVEPDPGKDPTTVYLPMLQGSKAEQRKWWLYNRFRYMDSKWNAGDALSDVIQLRGYAKADITVTPYADIYPTIKYGSYLVAERGSRGHETLLPCPLDAVNDTEIYVYSASQLASVGDLSGLKVGFADFSKAVRLQSVVVGSGAQGYVNQNLTELSIGNSKLLSLVDARNCVALTGSVDLSGAPNITTVLMQGTSVSSVSLPVGGILETLRLPATVSNLTIRNQGSITLFSIDGGEYNAITTLRIENCGDAIPIFDILEDMANGSRVRLIGMSTSASTLSDVFELYDRFDLMSGLDESGGNLSKAVVSGKITGIGEARRAQLNRLAARYPNVAIECALIKEGSIVRFYNGDKLLQYIDDSPNGQTAEYTGPMPVHPTAPLTHEFVWWYPTNEDIQDETNCYAQYHDTESITVKYLEDRIVDLDTLDVDTIKKQAFDHTRMIETVTTRATRIGEKAFYYAAKPLSVTMINPVTIEQNAFGYTKIASLDTRGGVTLEKNAFGYASGDHIAMKLNAIPSNGEPFNNAKFERLDLSFATTMTANIEQLTNSMMVRTLELRLIGSEPCSIGGLSAYFGTKHLILNGNFTFSDKYISSFGTFNTPEHAVYVPSELLETFRGYEFFSGGEDVAYGYSHKNRRHRVFSIDDYPVTDFSTVSDTWAEIVAASRNGTYRSRYTIGDIKKLEMLDDTYVYMQLVAFDTDVLASDTTQTVPMTWLCCYSPTSRAMRFGPRNSPDVSWETSEVRSRLASEVLPQLPETIRNAVKTVRKYSRTVKSAELSDVVATDDAIWIAGMRELGHDESNYENAGPNYGLDSCSYGTRTVTGTDMSYSGSSFVMTRTAAIYSPGTDSRTGGYRTYYSDYSISTEQQQWSYQTLFGFCL